MTPPSFPPAELLPLHVLTVEGFGILKKELHPYSETALLGLSTEVSGFD